MIRPKATFVFIILNFDTQHGMQELRNRSVLVKKTVSRIREYSGGMGVKMPIFPSTLAEPLKKWVWSFFRAVKSIKLQISIVTNAKQWHILVRQQRRSAVASRMRLCCELLTPVVSMQQACPAGKLPITTEWNCPPSSCLLHVTSLAFFCESSSSSPHTTLL